MAKKVWAVRLPNVRKAEPKVPVIGVFAACDPRIDEVSFHMGRVCRAYHLGWSKKSLPYPNTNQGQSITALGRVASLWSIAILAC